MDYKSAGIDNEREFYKYKFASKQNFDFTKDIMEWYNINNFKQLWMYCNIKPESRILDFGCGSGALACLKNKNCYLAGIDYSAEAIKYACEVNGYDEGFAGSIFECEEFDYASFDYVVSLDVFGHISFDEKDKIIKELKWYLKDKGTMLHGIECGDIDYDNMTEQEKKDFVAVDGHVGLESMKKINERFERAFLNVTSALRYDCLVSVEEIIKQTESYCTLKRDPHLSLWLNNLNHKEKESFNIGMGLAMRNIFNNKIPCNEKNGGFLFLKASDGELAQTEIHTDFKFIDQTNSIYNENIFMSGWCPTERSSDRGAFRWMTESSMLSFLHSPSEKVLFKMGTYNPRVLNGEKECVVHFMLENGKEYVSKIKKEPILVEMDVNESTFIKIWSEDIFTPGGGMTEN